MHLQRWWTLVLLSWTLWPSSSQGHFLFVRILPAAEAGRHVEVYFSDLAEAGDPRFLDKIASTRLWLQTKPGSFEPLRVLKAEDRLRALVPSTGSVSVIGECTYGVLERPKQPAFLLRHYPKAIAGLAEDVNAFQPKAEIPFEIQVREEGVGLQFSVLRNGKPVPGATFNVVAVGSKDHKLTANDQGKAQWNPSGAGTYAVYASQTLKESGNHQGKKYEEIREFATLAFTWPLQPEAADAAAIKLFQDAMAARASWHDFPGFTAQINAYADGRTWKGSVTVSSKGDVELGKEDEIVAPWVKEQLDSLAMHRIVRSQGKTPILRFADSDKDHPLGRLLVFEGGKFASSYRVKDRQILVVNRAMGKSNMTITVLENDLDADKKFLPRAYSVQYWDAVTGQLKRCETVQNRWTRLDAWDLPTQLIVLASSETGLAAKTMTLSEHRLLKTPNK